MQKLLGEHMRNKSGKITRILADSVGYMTFLKIIEIYGQNSHILENKLEHEQKILKSLQ
jgi:hypothetical protein